MNWLKNNLANLTNQLNHFIISVFPTSILFAFGMVWYVFTGNVLMMLVVYTFWFGLLIGFEINQYQNNFRYWLGCKVLDTICDIIAGCSLFTVLVIVWYLII